MFPSSSQFIPEKVVGPLPTRRWKPVQITGDTRSGRGPGPGYVTYVFCLYR
jgi:hypothetical protein